VLREIDKLRQAISRGSLDCRQDLVEKLGKLAMSLAIEAKFEKVLEVMDEILELTETLLEEGKIEITQTMVEAVYPVSSVAKMTALQRNEMKKLDEEAFFQRRKKCVSMLTEEEFLGIKNEWALDIHERAEYLHDNGATIAAIALLDESLQKFEPLFDPKVRQFTELKPLLDIYQSRGMWKCEVGDQESGIADLLHFEQFAEQADKLLKRNRTLSQDKNRNAVQDGKQSGKIIIRLTHEDMIDHYASFSFQESRYEAILHLANAYHVRAEKEKALEYYDKAIAIVEENEDVQERAKMLFFSAPMDIPYRKGIVFSQYHQFEEALEQYDLAIKNVKDLLHATHEDTDRQKRVSQLESLFAEVSQARAETLRQLGRFDEAKNAVELTKQLFTNILKSDVLKTDAVGDDYPLSMQNLLAPASRRETKPLRRAIPEGEEFDEQKVLLQFGVLHNEAIMQVQQAKIEMHAGRWRKALRLLLKARFVIDSPLIAEFPEAKKNLLNIYTVVAGLYASLKEYEKAQTWYERAIRFAETLIDKGEYELQDMLCKAQEGLGLLYVKTKQYEKSLATYLTAFAQRERMIESYEAALEGLDREHLRVHDNQKLMPLAVLYQAQIGTIRSIEELIFALDKSEDAESWAKVEMETFEKFRALLQYPEQSDGDYATTIASCAAMLRWGGKEEKCQELLAHWFAYQKESFDTTDDAHSYINAAVAIRLLERYAMTDFDDGAQLYNRMNQQAKQNQFEGMYETARVFRSLLVHEQKQLQEPPLIKREFYECLIAFVDNLVQKKWDAHSVEVDETVYRNHPYNPDEVRAILDKVEAETKALAEEDDTPDDEDASLYERDFETSLDNHAMFFKMLDAFSGNNAADKLIQGLDSRQKGMMGNAAQNVGRNDPCPCGSGKKYKTCCLKRQNK
jgi:preprotein translocase subunit SecA